MRKLAGPASSLSPSSSSSGHVHASLYFVPMNALQFKNIAPMQSRLQAHEQMSIREGHALELGGLARPLRRPNGSLAS